jgi:hypothetical protein
VGLEKYVWFDRRVPRWLKEIELYFGNIDVRHHLLRQPDPEAATRELAYKYMEAAARLAEIQFKSSGIHVSVKVYELLPIEDESRSIPKTGWYEGTPFYGSMEDRDKIRLIFKEELKKWEGGSTKVFEWVDKLINKDGELDFKYMEKPKSIHLSREFYPHWHGKEYNRRKEEVNNPEIHNASLEGLI